MNRGFWKTHLEKLLWFGVAASMMLLVLRFVLSGKPTYLFLVWNLCLAIIPYVVAKLMTRLSGAEAKVSLAWGGLLLIWFVFFPNAPYLFTDYIHLDRLTDPDELAYDAALISAFAVTGFAFGLFSLFLVHENICKVWGWFFGWTTVVGVALFSGYGVYLGRFPRWNSWDIITHPMRLLQDAVWRLSAPLSHPKLVLTTGLFASFILVTYGTFRFLFRSLEREERDENI